MIFNSDDNLDLRSFEFENTPSSPRNSIPSLAAIAEGFTRSLVTEGRWDQAN